MGEVAKQLSSNEVLLLKEQLLASNLEVPSSELLYNVAYRILQDSTLYYSKQYKRVKSRNSFTVKFKDVDGTRRYGQVLFFVSISGQVFVFIMKLQAQSLSCQDHFCIYHDSLDHIPVSKIVPLKNTDGSMVCIPASNLISKCVFISVDDDLCKCKYVVSSTSRLSSLFEVYFVFLISIRLHLD